MRIVRGCLARLPVAGLLRGYRCGGGGLLRQLPAHGRACANRDVAPDRRRSGGDGRRARHHVGGARLCADTRSRERREVEGVEQGPVDVRSGAPSGAAAARRCTVVRPVGGACRSADGDAVGALGHVALGRPRSHRHPGDGDAVGGAQCGDDGHPVAGRHRPEHRLCDDLAAFDHDPGGADDGRGHRGPAAGGRQLPRGLLRDRAGERQRDRADRDRRVHRPGGQRQESTDARGASCG